MFSSLSLPKALPGYDEGKVNQDATCAEVLPNEIHWDQMPDKTIKRIIKGAFRSLTKEFKSKGLGFGGTTASISLQVPDQKGTRVFFANAGDSCGMLLSKASEKDQIDILFRTKDHSSSCPEEQKRILSLGGAVGMELNTGLIRIIVDGFPTLSPSRGFGDHACEPYVSHTPIVSKSYIPSTDRQNRRVVHFSDGVYKAIPEGWIYASSKNNYILKTELTAFLTKQGSKRFPGAFYALPDTDKYDEDYIKGASWAQLASDTENWLQQILKRSQVQAHQDVFGVGVKDSDDTTGSVAQIATLKSGALLSGVFDGHGPQGDKCASYAAKNLGKHMIAYAKKHCSEYCTKVSHSEPSLLHFFLKVFCSSLEKTVSPAMSDVRFFNACRTEGPRLNQYDVGEGPELSVMRGW